MVLSARLVVRMGRCINAWLKPFTGKSSWEIRRSYKDNVRTYESNAGGCVQRISDSWLWPLTGFVKAAMNFIV